MKKIDMHVHSEYSGDNYTNPEDTIKVAIKRGLDGVVFTEHDTYIDSKVFEHLSNKYLGTIMIFRCMELTTMGSHTLVYGADIQDVADAQMISVQKAVDTAKSRGGIAIPSHPFRWGIGELLKDTTITALEGINGANTAHQNILAMRLAKSMGVKYIAGSDSHDPDTVGRVYTEFDDSVVDLETLIEALRCGNFNAVATDLYEDAYYLGSW